MKKLTIIIVCIMLAKPWQVQGMTGSGTVSDPYLISTYNDLKLVKNNLSAVYLLTGNIDASSSVTDDGGLGFEPVGSFSGTPFTGKFYGSGNAISNLVISRSGQNYIGLFGYLGSGSVVDSLGLENVNIKGNAYVGAIAGINDGNITNSYSTGSVTGSGNYAGGIVGDNYSYGNIVSCYSNSSVKGVSSVGGLAGYNIKIITKSHASGAVSGTGNNIGGLAGDNPGGGVISYSYATGTVNGTTTSSKDNIGGLTGRNDGNIANCYATGNVNGGQWSTGIGGLVGNNVGGNINNCYSIGKVTGWRLIGGLAELEVGAGIGTTTNSYWNIAASGVSVSEGGGSGKTSTQMVHQSTFSTWNFSSIWAIDEGKTYPYLRENIPVPILAPPALTIEGSFSARDKIYDGTTLASISASNLTLKGIAGGDVVTLSAIASFVTPDIGKNISVTLQNSTPSGTNGGKYIISFTDAPATVASIKKGLTIDGSFTVSDKQYDGNTSAVIIANNLVLIGITGSDEVSLNTIAAFVNADAEENKTVTLAEACSISGANADDYILSLLNAPASLATISKADTPAPGPPALSEKTTSSILLVADPSLEFSIDNGISWQDSDLFDGLETATYYAFTSRVKERPNYKTSPKGEILEVITNMTGSGTAEDPYLISTYNGLKIVKEHLSANYRLINNIDASESASENNGAGFEPIGYEWPMPFSGIFNGGGHRIANLTVNRSDAGITGLFGHIEGALIDSLGLINANIKGNTVIGAGTLAGVNSFGIITDCYASGTLFNAGSNCGGLVGLNYGTISRCYSTVSVEGISQAGGLVGYNNGGSITDSYAVGNVTAVGTLGGLAGAVMGGSVTNCYSIGLVSGNTDPGSIGGLTGNGFATVSNSFWNIETSGMVASASGTGLTGSVMLNQTTFTDWNFTDTWAIVEGKTFPGILTINNAPFAFNDIFTSTETIPLSDMLLNDYDIETGSNNLVLQVISNRIGTINNGSLYFSDETIPGTIDTLVYRVGEKLAADTLWGNIATAFITYTITTDLPGIAGSGTLLHVFPNPVHDVLFIEKCTTQLPMINIYDLHGRLLLRTRESKINMSGLPNGVYILDADGTMIKIIKK